MNSLYKLRRYHGYSDLQLVNALRELEFDEEEAHLLSLILVNKPNIVTKSLFSEGQVRCSEKELRLFHKHYEFGNRVPISLDDIINSYDKQMRSFSDSVDGMVRRKGKSEKQIVFTMLNFDKNIVKIVEDIKIGESLFFTHHLLLYDSVQSAINSAQDIIDDTKLFEIKMLDNFPTLRFTDELSDSDDNTIPTSIYLTKKNVLLTIRDIIKPNNPTTIYRCTMHYYDNKPTTFVKRLYISADVNSESELYLDEEMPEQKDMLSVFDNDALYQNSSNYLSKYHTCETANFLSKFVARSDKTLFRNLTSEVPLVEAEELKRYIHKDDVNGDYFKLKQILARYNKQFSAMTLKLDNIISESPRIQTGLSGFRGINQNELSDLEIGNVVVFNNFISLYSSASMAVSSSEENLRGKVLELFFEKSNVSGIVIPLADNHYNALLQRGLRFRVTGKKYFRSRDGKYYLTYFLEYLDSFHPHYMTAYMCFDPSFIYKNISLYK